MKQSFPVFIFELIKASLKLQKYLSFNRNARLAYMSAKIISSSCLACWFFKTIFKIEHLIIFLYASES